MVPGIILPTMQPLMAVRSSTGSSSGSCRGCRSQHQWTPPVPPPVVINTTEGWWHTPPPAVHSPPGPVVAMPGHHSPSRCCESLTKQCLSCDSLQIIYSQPTAPYPPPTLFPQQPIMPVPIAGMGFPPIWKIFPTLYYKTLCFLPIVTQPPPILINPLSGLTQWVNVLLLPIIVFPHSHWTNEWTSCFFLLLSLFTLIDPIRKPPVSPYHCPFLCSCGLIQWANLLLSPIIVPPHSHWINERTFCFSLLLSFSILIWIDLMSEPPASFYYCPSSPLFGLIQWVNLLLLPIIVLSHPHLD